MASRLFPTELSTSASPWVEFPAQGFTNTVPGTIHRGTHAPACGMPLGGIDTGCLDLEVRGLLGYSSIFNSLSPRRGPINVPFLGLTVGLQTWVLTTLNLSNRTDMTWRHLYGHFHEYNGARTANEIHYWGHYPVADLEYETGAPVSVGLRAWSPFLPGDTAASNTPGAVFEVHLRNESEQRHSGALVFNFPGPSEAEAGDCCFERERVTRDSFDGLVVRGPRGPQGTQASYALGVIAAGAPMRVGGDLGVDGEAWASAADFLPHAVRQGGASLAVDYALEPGEEKVIRFVLAWFSPVWMGGGTMTEGGNPYTHMYAARFAGALDVAVYLAREHAALLRRILAWQQVVYGEQQLPPWLRDAFVNVLHLITEVSVWAQAKPPIGEWCRPEDGVFGLNESPRGCPQIECIPCSFYGNLPIVYFFPDLALSSLRAYKAYQMPSGAAPWVYGGLTTGTKPYEMALPSPGYSNKPQTTLDGPCYADLVDKLWRRSGDDAIAREFYESLKRNTIFTMNLRPGSGAAGIVSMPADNAGQDWIESCDLFGIVPHIGGAHLAELRIARRMAEVVGDGEFARQCDEWITQGSAVMETHAWAGTHYMLFNELETGRQSDIVMGYQLDGEWMARFHGLAGVFRPERVKTTLETLKHTSVAMAPFGAAVFCKPGAQALGKDDWNPGYWGPRGVHPPGTFMLAMTYMYNGERDFGFDLARRPVEEIIRRGWYWDWPVCIDRATGPREGFDYYQNLMLWSLAAACNGQDLSGPCQPGGLAARMIDAATE